MTLILGIIFWLIALTVAITIHEFAHAYVANYLGDPTAKLHGRLSLNPLNHYDRVGTTMLLVTVLLRALGAPIIPIGWAKPVQFDPYNLENPRRDAAIISLAGPLANFLLAILLALFLRIPSMGLTFNILNLVFVPIIMLNVVLGLFNLVPIHPLDGGKILVGILPKDMAPEAERILSQYGLIILLFLIIPFQGTSPIFLLIGPILDIALKLLIP